MSGVHRVSHAKTLPRAGTPQTPSGNFWELLGTSGNFWATWDSRFRASFPGFPGPGTFPHPEDFSHGRPISQAGGGKVPGRIPASGNPSPRSQQPFPVGLVTLDFGNPGSQELREISQDFPGFPRISQMQPWGFDSERRPLFRPNAPLKGEERTRGAHLGHTISRKSSIARGQHLTNKGGEHRQTPPHVLGILHQSVIRALI